VSSCRCYSSIIVACTVPLMLSLTVSIYFFVSISVSISRACRLSPTFVIFPPIFFSKICLRLGAGSVKTSSVFSPVCAAFKAIAAAVVDFPTPPFPPTNIICCSISFIFILPFTCSNNNEYRSSENDPSPFVNAIHEILQSYMDTIPMCNKIQDYEYQSFLNKTTRNINHLHSLILLQFLLYGAG